MNNTEPTYFKPEINWRYTLTARIFHWVIAVYVFCMLSLGWYMMSLGDKKGSDWYFNLHKSLGLLIAFLILARIAWRLFHKPGPLPDTVPIWQARASRLVHFLLYLCLIFMPLTGFLATSLGKGRLKFFGFALPDWIPKNHWWSELLFSIHGYIAWILLGLVILHILAAFKHLLVNRDNVFKRMWF